MTTRQRNHRDEIAEITNLERHFNEPFENREQLIQNETLVRFRELLKENELNGGALDDFSNEGPWRAHFYGFIDALEAQWKKQLLNPAERKGINPEFLAGGVKILEIIKGKLQRDSVRSEQLGFARQAETEARNVHQHSP